MRKEWPDPCRQFLESYRELMSEVDRLWRKHLRLENQATQITARLSPVPGGGGSNREELLALLADSDGDVLRRMTEAEQRAKEIEELIDRIPTPAYRVVLRLRYLECLPWNDIERRMEKSKYAYVARQIYRIHGKALMEARGVWEEMNTCG